MTNYTRGEYFEHTVYLEGLRIADNGCTIAYGLNQPASALINVDPLPEFERIPARSLVVITVPDFLSPTLERPIFMGEVVESSYSHTRAERTITIHCMDLSHYFDFLELYSLIIENPLSFADKYVDLSGRATYIWSGGASPTSLSGHLAAIFKNRSLFLGIHDLLEELINGSHTFFRCMSYLRRLPDLVAANQDDTPEKAYGKDYVQHLLDLDSDLKSGKVVSYRQIINTLFGFLGYMWIVNPSPAFIDIKHTKGGKEEKSWRGLTNIMFFPAGAFTSPPTCNIIWPDYILSLTHRETRLPLTRYTLVMPKTLTRRDTVFPRVNVPNVLALLEDKSKASKDILKWLHELILPSEVFCGPMYKLDGLNISSRPIAKVLGENETQFARFQAVRNYLLNRFAGQMTVTLRGIYPYIVPGLPAVVVDDLGNGKRKIVFGTVAQLTYTMGKGSVLTEVVLVNTYTPDEDPAAGAPTSYTRQTTKRLDMSNLNAPSEKEEFREPLTEDSMFGLSFSPDKVTKVYQKLLGCKSLNDFLNLSENTTTTETNKNASKEKGKKTTTKTEEKTAEETKEMPLVAAKRAMEKLDITEGVKLASSWRPGITWEELKDFMRLGDKVDPWIEIEKKINRPVPQYLKTAVNYRRDWAKLLTILSNQMQAFKG